MTKYHLDLNFVPKADLNVALDRTGDSRKQKIFTLQHPDGLTIANRRCFLDAVVYSFPLNPPMVVRKEGHLWDAVQDSLRGGLWDLTNVDFIDVVWPDIHIVTQKSIPTLVEGCHFLLRATDAFNEYYRGKKSVYTRILLVYEENALGFVHPF